MAKSKVRMWRWVSRDLCEDGNELGSLVFFWDSEEKPELKEFPGRKAYFQSGPFGATAVCADKVKLLLGLDVPPLACFKVDFTGCKVKIIKEAE